MTGQNTYTRRSRHLRMMDAVWTRRDMPNTLDAIAQGMFQALSIYERVIFLVKKQKYWVLNAKVITLVSAITILVTLILVFILGHKSFLVELERSVAVISIVLFLFLSHCLYRGVRLKYEPIVRDKPYNLKFSDKAETLECIPDLLFNIELAEAGLVWIIFSIVATILLFVFGNVLIDVFIFAVGAIYWVFYRALRLAIIKSRQSKGKLLVSLGYSFVYTLLYTGWLYAVFFGYKIFVH